MLINPKGIDLNQKRKLKSASRPFNSLGSRFITAAPCFRHGGAERVVAPITAAGRGKMNPEDGGARHPAFAGAYALWTVRTGRSVRNLPTRFPSGGMKGDDKAGHAVPETLALLHRA